MKWLLILALAWICAMQSAESRWFESPKRGTNDPAPYHGECDPENGMPMPWCKLDKQCKAECSDPDAYCMINICGGCRPIWFKVTDGGREEVTDCH